MKTIHLEHDGPSLSELLATAGQEAVLLRTTDGRRFLLAEIDDLSEESEQIRSNESLMRLLEERSKEEKRYTLEEVRELLSKD